MFLDLIQVGLLVVIVIMLGALQNEWKEMTKALEIAAEEMKGGREGG